MSAAFSEFLGRKQALRGLPEVGAAKVRIVGAMNTDLIARLPVRPMTSDLDIYRSAKLLIDKHGEDASGFAAKQAGKQAKAGDREGRAV